MTRYCGERPLRVEADCPDSGVGRTHAPTRVQDLEIRIANAATGDLLRELAIDPDRDYQPRTTK